MARESFFLEVTEQNIGGGAVTVHCIAQLEQNGPRVGYAQLRVSADLLKAEIANLLVLEDHRGGGIGNALLTSVEACAREKGVKTIDSWVRHPEYIGFFESHGYHVDGKNVEKSLR